MAVVRRLVNLISYEEVPGEGADEARANAHNVAMAFLAAGVISGVAAIGIAALEVAIGAAGEAAFRAEQRIRALSDSQQAAAGNVDLLKSSMGDLPFFLTDLTKSFVQLQKLGLDPTRGMLRDLGNIAMGSGQVGLNAVTKAVKQASSGQVEALTSLGLEAEKRGNQVRVAFRDTAITVDQSATGIVRALRHIASEEQRFAGQVEQATERPLNRMMMLVNRLVLAFADISDELTPFINDAIDSFERLVVAFEKNEDEVVEALIPAFNWLSGLLHGIIDAWIMFKNVVGGAREAMATLMDVITIASVSLLVVGFINLAGIISTKVVAALGAVRNLLVAILMGEAAMAAQFAVIFVATVAVLAVLEEIYAIFDDDLHGTIEQMIFKTQTWAEFTSAVGVLFLALAGIIFGVLALFGAPAAIVVAAIGSWIIVALELYQKWDEIKTLFHNLWLELKDNFNDFIGWTKEWMQWLGRVTGLLDSATDKQGKLAAQGTGRIGVSGAQSMAAGGISPMELQRLKDRGLTEGAARTLRQNNSLELTVPAPEDTESPEEYGRRLADEIDSRLQDLADDAESSEKGGER